jgi:hypothetical protein
MNVFSRKAAISLACAAILGGFAATPAAAGVITPAEKATVAPESPLDFVGWRRICHWHCHVAWRPTHSCVVASDYPRYGWCHRRHYCVDRAPVYVVAPGWGGGWGWGGGGGLFGFL